jgi:uncharacterized repeat protein (TIGR03803 family)
MRASDGNFYGTTASGGANRCPQIPQAGGNCGTVFRMSQRGATKVIYSFGASPSDGVTPNGSLLQARDGNLYGTTVNGGANSCGSTGERNNCGTVFKVTLGGVATVLHSFGGSLAAGAAPQGALLQGTDGAFYGTTVAGGDGTVFRLAPDGTFTVLHAFAQISRADGDGPSPYLLFGRDASIYGTTGSGGASGGSLDGTVFKLTPTGALTTL